MTDGKKYIPLFMDMESRFHIPAQFLYALAGRESRWNAHDVAGIHGAPTADDIKHHAVGLFQITKGVVKDYNTTHDTSYTKSGMLDPRVNATIAAWYLSEKVIPKFQVEWNNAKQIAIIAQAWNSGPYATKRIVDALGNQTVTVDAVKKLAEHIVKSGKEFDGRPAVDYKWLAGRNTNWAKGVARDTIRAFSNVNFTVPVQAGQNQLVKPRSRRSTLAKVNPVRLLSWLILDLLPVFLRWLLRR